MTDSRRPSRHTRQQAEVHALLNETKEFRSAQRIHADLHARGIKVGLTTVYRTLSSLADAGEIDALRQPNGEQVYRHCSSTHHHHLMCRSCARAVEVAGPAVETWASAVARQHGFTEVNHSIEIFGLCDSCASSSDH
ncbi:Fur family transcriptional regulator [Actinoplanes auranticolor]|uniref:Fur family transcriptional regulator n=1 Tax=Actinoplanes auranticolor TaxID=47988 RepID=UPI001BB34F43|nr:Fur family transcriptional regulator [Actinoplanes auranticolor]